MAGPLRLRAARATIWLAGLFVPKGNRTQWRRQWWAELEHRWQRGQTDGPARRTLLWSLGSFVHALYLVRTEFTMDSIFQDIKYGVRSLRRGAGLIAVAVVSIALGIGANSSIFSAVDVFMLQPLPYPDADDLYVVYITNEERGWTQVWFSMPDFLDLRDRVESFEVATSFDVAFNLSGVDTPERLTGARVSSNFFAVLQVQPALGRGFSPDEEHADRDNVIVLSDGLWKRRFGGQSSILGQTVLLDGEAHTIVGVMPEGFWYEEGSAELWAPLGLTGNEPRNARFHLPVARLRPGTSIDAARAEARRVMGNIGAAHPETSRGIGGNLEPLHSLIFDEGFFWGSLIASAAVAFVLLIACANAANLLLTRAAGRAREVAVRSALGAGRIRIVRQFLTESMLVAVLGGALGIVFAAIGIKGLIAIMPDWFPRVDELGLSARVLTFTGVLSLGTGLLFGLAPAFQGANARLTDALNEGGRGGSAGKSGRLRRALVVAEVSLALVLVVSSVLLVKGFMRLQNSNYGWDGSDVLTFRVALPAREYQDNNAVDEFYRRLIARLRAIPNVTEVGGIGWLPLRGRSRTWYSVANDPTMPTDPTLRPVAEFNYAFAGYFEAMDLPLLSGRLFDERDARGAPRVAIISEALAERHWPDGNPLGERLVFDSGDREIVGVVGNSITERGAIEVAEPGIYFAGTQSTRRVTSWVLETTSPPGDIADHVRAEVTALDPNLPPHEVLPMMTVFAEELGTDAIMAKIMATLAGIALVLALGGVYGVMAYTVSQRTRELGVRIALGAQRGDVIRMVVRQGGTLALVGVGVGLAVALGVTRGLSFFLFGVNPLDVTVFAAVSALLIVAGVSATYFPARRATRVDPVIALRTD